MREAGLTTSPLFTNLWTFLSFLTLMPSRRPHPKSRHGCVQCKLRKVKCGAQTPICSNCQRRGESCSFLSTFQPLKASDTASRLPNPALTPVPITGGTLNGVPDTLRLDLQTLELMHHYSTVVCFTLSKDSQVQQLWQNQVPKDALIHPFLMHCVMAASALHLADTVPTRRNAYSILAMRHHGIALSTYKSMLHDITKANCGPLSTGAKLLIVFIAAYSVLPGAVGVSVSIKGLMGVAELVRGSRIILETIDARAVEEDQFRQVTVLKDWDHDPALPQGLSEAIETIKTIVVTQIETADVKSVYLSTLDIFVKTFQACYLNPDHPELVLMFLSQVDQKFIDLSRSTEQLALIILAYYGIVLNLVKENWWAKNWGSRVVKEIYDSLDASSRSLIQIPMEQVGLTQFIVDGGHE
jgi:hypothetical protein